MFETVLVPTDFSKYSDKVLECVGGLPGVKKVVLLNVIGPVDPLATIWNPGARLKVAKKKLLDQAKLLEAQGLEVEQRAEPMLEGEIFRNIQEVSEEEGVNLVVMGARGKGFLQNIFLGNVAKNVLRYGDRHLLLMRYKMLEGGIDLEEYCAMITTKVLCPTDFSEPSEEAIRFVKGMIGVREVVLLNVVFSGESQAHVDAKMKEAREKLNAIKEGFERDGIKASVLISMGDPAEEIIAVAEDENVSLVAMSSHGKGWMKQHIVGSVVYEVSKNGTKPVLVLRASKAS